MTVRLDYREYRPSSRLAEIVDCFWTSANRPPAPAQHRVLPDGCMDVLFDFRAAGDARATVVGTMTRPLLVASDGPVDLLGVRFRPGGLPALFDLDAAEATDQRIPLAGLIGARADSLWSRLAETESDHRPQMLDHLLGAFGQPRIDPLVGHCVARIGASGGSLKMAELEAETGLSLRQIERRFDRRVGISPKTHARIIRFQAAVASLAAPALGWADRAFACHYSDQAHLTREFRSLSGLTPEAYARSMSDSFKTDRDDIS